MYLQRDKYLQNKINLTLTRHSVWWFWWCLDLFCDKQQLYVIVKIVKGYLFY